METNLLKNGSFEGGYYFANGVPEFAIPADWDFWYQDDQGIRIHNQDDPFYRPEMVVWDRPHAPENEKNLFWLDGIYCLKGFKGWGPIWFALSQKVSGLEVGAKYKFTVPVFPDLVMRYDGSNKVFADDVRAGECLLSVSTDQAVTDMGWINGTVMKFGQYNFMSLEFVADKSEMTVRLQLRGIYGLLTNGFFLDNLSLVKISGSIGTTPTPSPVVSAISWTKTGYWFEASQRAFYDRSNGMLLSKGETFEVKGSQFNDGVYTVVRDGAGAWAIVDRDVKDEPGGYPVTVTVLVPGSNSPTPPVVTPPAATSKMRKSVLRRIKNAKIHIDWILRQPEYAGVTGAYDDALSAVRGLFDSIISDQSLL